MGTVAFYCHLDRVPFEIDAYVSISKEVVTYG